ncbi:MAG: hypothetical protein NWE92_04715 [Candidatus Bathyarchaeota archaeon]|nr:hypothetical protein [Candidatus Bathyarchaeota archaeon]
MTSRIDGSDCGTKPSCGIGDGRRRSGGAGIGDGGSISKGARFSLVRLLGQWGLWLFR